MSSLIPASSGHLEPVRTPSLTERHVLRQTARNLLRIDASAAVRVRKVEREADVQTVKAREVGSLARESMTSAAMLAKWRDTLSGSDPLLNDELRYFSDLARVGMGEIIADTIGSFCRESRGQQ